MKQVALPNAKQAASCEVQMMEQMAAAEPAEVKPTEKPEEKPPAKKPKKEKAEKKGKDKNAGKEGRNKINICGRSWFLIKGFGHGYWEREVA